MKLGMIKTLIATLVKGVAKLIGKLKAEKLKATLTLSFQLFFRKEVKDMANPSEVSLAPLYNYDELLRVAGIDPEAYQAPTPTGVLGWVDLVRNQGKNPNIEIIRNLVDVSSTLPEAKQKLIDLVSTIPDTKNILFYLTTLQGNDPATIATKTATQKILNEIEGTSTGSGSTLDTEGKTMADTFETGTAQNRDDLFDKIINFITRIEGWTILDDQPDYKILKRPALSKVEGEREPHDIIIGFIKQQGKIGIRGFLNWNPDTHAGDGEIYEPSFTSFHVDSLPFLYWLFGNPDRIIIVTRIGSRYSFGHAGLIKPYFPNLDPYPLLIGGTHDGGNQIFHNYQATGTRRMLWVKDNQQAFPFYSYYNFGGWAPWGHGNAFACMTDENPLVFPFILLDGGIKQVRGEVIGVYQGPPWWGPGDIVKIAGKDHMVFHPYEVPNPNHSIIIGPINP